MSVTFDTTLAALAGLFIAILVFGKLLQVSGVMHGRGDAQWQVEGVLFVALLVLAAIGMFLAAPVVLGVMG